ncbi:Cof-type HAD-IIB family hydrolase [Exiguobacterium artemiae]|uniref:Cof-type HAD-IIB family hydrolase n=1 Tax=Exiguobacterium artemiae TaxID=340145 RepID=UPI002965117B|nr:Cof-type HAD-IIB family hydrolase [Exiguobacterium sibiricum]MDW2887047.1 Cof-type HAD-IIB family hydrolase [Exiguobacterium sibiricum]
MRLFAIDLDGTLLHSTHIISERNVSAVKRCQENGDIVVIATGRAAFDAAHLLRLHQLDCPIIGSNGAELRAEHEGKTIRKNTYVSSDGSEAILNCLLKQDVYLHIYVEDEILMTYDATDQLMKQIKEEQRTKPSFQADEFIKSVQPQLTQYGVRKVTDFSDVDLAKVMKFMIVSPKAAVLKRIENDLSSRNCTVTSSGSFNLEITANGSDKGMALQQFAERLEISLTATIAIGDNHNDLPMFRVAGNSIAMGNAEDAVKRQATEETGHHDNDGVATALETFCSIQVVQKGVQDGKY